MTRLALAVAAALLVSAAPSFAEEPPCRDCPMHKAEAASADQAAKKKEPAACACGAASHKDCKCAPGKCACSEKKASKKDATKS